MKHMIVVLVFGLLLSVACADQHLDVHTISSLVQTEIKLTRDELLASDTLAEEDVRWVYNIYEDEVANAYLYQQVRSQGIDGDTLSSFLMYDYHSYEYEVDPSEEDLWRVFVEDVSWKCNERLHLRYRFEFSPGCGCFYIPKNVPWNDTIKGEFLRRERILYYFADQIEALKK